jgi:PAS domain S-box-containing protein
VLTRALIDESPTATIAMDADGRLLEFNPAAERLSGFGRDEVLGRDMADFLVPERSRRRFHDHLRTYAETGNPEEFTGTLRIATMHADGTERTTELTPVQITMSGKAVFTGFLRDLTEIERSYAAMADQTELLNCLIANAVPGVLFTDERGRITHVSESYGALFGIAHPEQLVGTSAGSIVKRIQGVFADPEEFARRADEVWRARRPIFGEEIECADGRTVEGAYWPVLVDGQYRGDLWVAWDMSSRKELERRRNQFLATVSHEMRTPLTSIISFIELIRGEAEGLTPEGMTFLDVIERNADRLHRLVGDLLMLDRLEAGALPLDLTAVDVADLVTEAVASASPGALKQGVTIEFEAEEGPPVRGDFKRLMQVLDNLIANAVKFSHRNGLVRVTAGHHAGTWRIDVADSGIGVPEAEAGRLFSRFVRASNAQTAGLPGAGLGLSIVKVLVEMHDGHVEVRSALDRGSTFSVYLPAES